MPTLIEDAKASADWIVQALNSSGYKADFRLESLRELDRFFDEHSAGGRARPGGLLSTDLGSRLFALGSYMGEVLRRAYGGDWQADDQDPQGEINIQIVFANGGKVWPVQKVMKRLQNGPPESLLDYGLALKDYTGSPHET